MNRSKDPGCPASITTTVSANVAALSAVPIEALMECGADAPDDISDLLT
jgi:hypothetical protein